jgi:hypothetical protein
MSDGVNGEVSDPGVSGIRPIFVAALAAAMLPARTQSCDALSSGQQGLFPVERRPSLPRGGPLRCPQSRQIEFCARTGPGAEVLRRMGATVVLLPAGKIAPALKSAATTPANSSARGATWRSA